MAVEALGKALTFSQCARSVRDGGKAVMIGLAATNVVGEVDITRLVRRQVRRRTCPPLHRYRTALHCMHGSSLILSLSRGLPGNKTR